jgi:hypothetical protein
VGVWVIFKLPDVILTRDGPGVKDTLQTNRAHKEGVECVTVDGSPERSNVHVSDAVEEFRNHAWSNWCL